MKNTHVLDKLIEMTNKVLDQAGVNLANTLKTEQQAVEYLELLEKYKLDYAAQMQNMMVNGTDTISLSNYKEFLVSLGNAVDQARTAVNEQRRQVDFHQGAWHEANGKINAYETLVAKRSKLAAKKVSRAEQKDQDEFNSQKRVRAKSNPFMAGYSL